MKIISTNSQNNDSGKALEYCLSNLLVHPIEPDILLCYFTEEHDSHLIINTLKKRFPNTKIHGCTSCRGIMTDHGFLECYSIALWALYDSKHGRYGTSIAKLDNNHEISQLTKQLLEKAIKDSGREGELPALVLLHATPGQEEKIITAIDEYFGTPIPLIGGTAADNNVQGKWCIFTQDDLLSSGISLSVFYPSCKVSYSFHSGYACSSTSGIATKTHNRIIYEIDHKPVIDVYKQWTELPMGLGDKTNLLERVTQFPLGRIAGYMYSSPYFKLAHPVKFTHDGGMECFASINEGEEVFMMYGEEEQIISRPQRVINSAINSYEDNFSPIGGINIFCAGSMMHIKTSMDAVCHSVNSAMHGAPYICPFTFGEQGRFTGGENAHGNLMVSTVLFHY